MRGRLCTWFFPLPLSLCLCVSLSVGVGGAVYESCTLRVDRGRMYSMVGTRTLVSEICFGLIVSGKAFPSLGTLCSLFWNLKSHRYTVSRLSPDCSHTHTHTHIHRERHHTSETTSSLPTSYILHPTSYILHRSSSPPYRCLVCLFSRRPHRALSVLYLRPCNGVEEESHGRSTQGEARRD